MPTKGLLVISDIHYGDLSQFEVLKGKDVVAEGAFDAIAQLVKDALDREGLEPTLLLVPGDLTSRGSPKEFADSSLLIEKIRQVCGIPPSAALLTYGNHDVDWKIGAIHPLDDEKRALYCEFAAQCGGHFAPPPKADVAGPVVGSGVYKFDELDVIVLNSGIHCYPRHEENRHEFPHGSIKEKQLAWLREEVEASLTAGSQRVLMLHHHLANVPYPAPTLDISLLAEGAEVLASIGAMGVDLVVHGHRHHPAVCTKMETNWRHPVTFLCAGSYGVDSAHRSTGRIPNVFHFVSFEADTPQGNSPGCVWTFETNGMGEWRLLRDGMEDVALDSKQHFGSVATDSDLDQIIVSMLPNPALTAGMHHRLPSYQELPLSLRCLRYNNLADKLREVAAQQGLAVTGKYPTEQPLLTKREE